MKSMTMGPILAQRDVRLLVDDKPSDLAARILKEVFAIIQVSFI